MDRPFSYAESVGQFQPNSITLKAFANSSPGLRFGDPGITLSFEKGATLKGLRRRLFDRGRSQPLQGCASVKSGCASSQGFKANPGLELANAFSVRELLPQSGMRCSAARCALGSTACGSGWFSLSPPTPSGFRKVLTRPAPKPSIEIEKLWTRSLDIGFLSRGFATKSSILVREAISLAPWL